MATPISHPKPNSPPIGLRPVVATAKELIAGARSRLRSQHELGTPGIQICAQWTEILDGVVIRLFEAAVMECEADPKRAESALCLVPHGGYGRRDMAPHSDLDLMCLVDRSMAAEMASVIRVFSQMLYDTGLVVGFSQRNVAEAIDLALRDATIFTSLVEARYLFGAERLLNRFSSQFARKAHRARRRIAAGVVEARRDERQKNGDTPNLLEPNVKRSPGGLRDLQLVRWLGFACYGAVEPDALVMRGRLTKAVRNRLLKSRDFLLHVRNELHFHAGRQQDLLDKAEQLRMAALFGYVDRENSLAVESFMREYFSHTSEVRDAAFNFVDAIQESGPFVEFFAPLFTHRAGRDFRVGPRYIGATVRGRERLRESLADALWLMTLSCLYDKHIEPATWRSIRDSADQPGHLELTPDAIRQFLELMSQPLRLGELLRRLHAARLLERIIPAMAHARCLLQFNQYHKYTVDEHSLRAVTLATKFFHDPGPPGEVYRSIRNKRTLHLAVLLHDLGKGFTEDHSIVGERIAWETATRLGLPPQESEMLAFLVRRHLDMPHLAFRRDLSDPEVILRFAAEVGSSETLKHLYLLSVADLAAVGPGVLTDWKLDLLTELYARTHDCLTGAHGSGHRQRISKAIADVKSAIGASRFNLSLARILDSLPSGLVLGFATVELAEVLLKIADLKPSEAMAWPRCTSDRRSVRYAVAAHESIATGIFQRLTGVLSSQGMQILGAEIFTLEGGLVLDFFDVNDLDYSESPPASRMEEVCRALENVLKEPSIKLPTFRKVWSENKANAGPKLPTRVVIDNQTAQNMTVIDVFAHDRLGLLYTISRTLVELNLSVHIAKISTYLDQVVDVFYVTDRNSGGKVSDLSRCILIEEALLSTIHHLETTGEISP
jgi:[protein-PII] uridylyltransferase